MYCLIIVNRVSVNLAHVFVSDTDDLKCTV